MCLLNDEEWGKWSSRLIAEKCGVSDVFVSELRKVEVLTVSTSARTGKDGKSRPSTQPKRNPTPTSKPVEVVNTDTGEIIPVSSLKTLLS
jgi:hypothetical protein